MAITVNIPSEVTQTITEGVTTTAPSENAVFDALATKANTTDLNDLVPYTGAIGDVDLGTNDIYTNKVFLYDEVNDNHGSLHFTDTDFHIEDSDGHKMLVIEDGFIQLHLTDTIQSNLFTSDLTAIRDHYLPDASGTIALTSDIPTTLNQLTDVEQPPLPNGYLIWNDDAAIWQTNQLSFKTINSQSILGSGNIEVGGIAVGTTAVTSGTIGRVFFQGAGNVVQQSASLFWDNTNSRLGVGATPSTSVRLDVRAQGALSTDLALRVRNSADTQNLLSVSGDGRIAIGLNAQILGTTDAFKNVVIGGGAKDISSAGVSENSVALGYNAVSNNSGTAIGANTQVTAVSGVAVGASAYGGYESIAIGAGARADGTSGYQSLAIGKGARASALLSGIIAVGQSSYTNALGQTLAFCVDPTGANSQTMLLTNKANLVFKNSTQLTSGTHWNTTATNTLTIHNGTVPDGNIVDAAQFYVADIVAGNAAPHFRTENGGIIKLYQQTTSVGAATFASPGGGNTIKTDDTFDGYTVQKVVKALRNLGILA